MINRPNVVRLEWDDWNRKHISKHAVSREEAEDVVFGDPIARETYKRRFLLTGPSRAGRMLAIVIGADPDQAGAYYVFSARPASRKERGEYHQRKEDEAS